jgi:DNA-binding CsgD family transcriptional regulator
LVERKSKPDHRFPGGASQSRPEGFSRRGLRTDYGRDHSMEHGAVSWETSSLTDREREVLVLVVEGYSAKQIALALGIAPRTVECHIEHLRSKTNSRNRAQMAAEAVRSGVVPMLRTVA